MTIFIGHNTAAHFWLFASQKEVWLLTPTADPPNTVNAHDIESLELQNANEPIHLLVNSSRNARTYNGVKLHSCSDLPENSFRTNNEGARVACPELCFLQMATQLNFGQLVQFGNELCAQFYRNPESATGLSDRTPVTTPELICSYLSKCTNHAGHRNALAAAKWLVAGARSPQESALLLRLALPYARGGRAFGLPQLNTSITLTKTQQRLSNRAHIEADLLWPKQKLIVEYDGGESHYGGLNHTSDMIRQNVLVGMGYKVIRVTKAQLNNELLFEQLVEAIGNATKQTKRVYTKDFDKKQTALRASLALYLKKYYTKPCN